MASLKALYILSILLSPIVGLNCPSIDDLPVMDGLVFSCAKWWVNEGGSYSVDSCNGLLRDAMFYLNC